MIQRAQVTNLHIRFIKNLVDECRICVILLVAQCFLGLRVLAGFKVRFARGQILGIAKDKVAVIRRDDVGNVADVLQSHRARAEFFAVELALRGNRIAAQHLLLGGAVLVVSLHGFLEVLAAANRRNDRLRLGIAGHLVDVHRFIRRCLIAGRFAAGRLVVSRFAIHLCDVDALHQADIFRRIENLAVAHIVVDEAVDIGIAFLLRSNLRVKRFLDFFLGHADVSGRLLVDKVKHILEIRALGQGFLGVAAVRQLLFHRLRQLIAGVAVIRKIALIILAQVIQRGLHLSRQFFFLLGGQHIAVLLGIAADNRLAELHLNGFLRDIRLEFLVILVYRVAILRIVGDIRRKLLIVLFLNLRELHGHSTVIRARQNAVLQRDNLSLSLGCLRLSLGSWLCRRFFRRLGGRLFRRFGSRFFRRFSSRLFRRFGGRLFRRLSGRLFRRFGSRFFRRLGGRLCRYNRRSCCFGRFVLCAARAHRHERKRKHKRQHGLFHILYSLHTLCCRSFRQPQPQDHITVSVMLRSASKPYSPLYPPSDKKAIFSGNCLDDFMYHSQLRHNFPPRRAFSNASFTFI